MLKFNLRRKTLLAAEGNPSVPPSTVKENLKDAIIDSCVVGGIAGFSAYTADPNATLQVFAIAFGLAFLVKLKDLRNIN
mgnify:CR=1 FL=1